MSLQVVDEVSGVMEIPKETVVPMDGCDHQEICRFDDCTGSGYHKVSHHLEKLANGQYDPYRVASFSSVLILAIKY